jgi:hypothetical protein
MEERRSDFYQIQTGRSAMFYFDMFKGLKIQGPNAITDFLKDPENHDITISESKYALFSFTKNRMAIDFGFPKEELYQKLFCCTKHVDMIYQKTLKVVEAVYSSR